MTKRLVSVAATVILFLAWLGVGQAADYQALLKKADELYAQRADQAAAKEAVEVYRAAAAANPKSAEAAWKLARALYFVTERTEKDDQLPVLEEGIEAAKKAVELDPDCVPGHYWLGVLYGLYGQNKGILKSLSLVEPIKKTMAEVIKRDPGFEDGGAYMVVGRLYFKVPGFFGGDNDKAIENLKTALKYGPKRWLTYVYLAEVLMDEGEYDQAEELLNKALEGQCQPYQIVVCDLWKKDAQELMAKLQQKRD